MQLASIPGTTEVRHDSESTVAVERCPSQGCFVHQVNYDGATVEQILELIEASESCWQEISASDCHQLWF